MNRSLELRPQLVAAAVVTLILVFIFAGGVR